VVHARARALAQQRGNCRHHRRNTLKPEHSVHMHLLDGPLRTLEGRWLLAPIEPHGCRVDLNVRFEFKNRLAGVLLEPLFAQTLGSLVDAFVQRARAGT
jgi:ribosome-associated toxin RatA of RatAB toxin-antitoxin module